MRWVPVIVVLTVVAVVNVHLQRQSLSVNHDMQRLRCEQVRLEQELWDHQAMLTELTSPLAIREAMAVIPLDLIEKD
jgi:cell division protein FtsL